MASPSAACTVSRMSSITGWEDYDRCGGPDPYAYGSASMVCATCLPFPEEP